MSRNRDFTGLNCDFMLPKAAWLTSKAINGKAQLPAKESGGSEAISGCFWLDVVVVVVFKVISGSNCTVSGSNCIVLIYPHFPPDLHCWGKKCFSNLIQSISEWVASINPYWLVVEVSAHPYWPRRQIQTKEKNKINILLMGQYIFILARNLNLIFLMPSVGKKMKNNKKTLKNNKEKQAHFKRKERYAFTGNIVIFLISKPLASLIFDPNRINST